MNFKEKMKDGARFLGRMLLVGLRFTISKMPYIVFRMFSNFFILIGRPVVAKKKKIAMESLRLALGKELSEEKIQEIAGECLDNFGRGMIDLIYFADRPSEIKSKVRIEGKEHLEEALKKGNGAILVGAHFGNFILMYLRILLEGYKTNVIMRRTRDPKFEQYISNFRDEQGLKTIYDLPQRKCVGESLKALRNNEILIILLDQNFGGDGRVFVDFFGIKAATASGPVVFSSRTQAPILPVFIIKDRPSLSKGISTHRLVIEPPIKLDESLQGQPFLVKNVSRITRIIEKYIRQYPAEWGGWMHKRWKARTREEQIVIDREREMGIRKSDTLYYAKEDK